MSENCWVIQTLNSWNKSSLLWDELVFKTYSCTEPRIKMLLSTMKVTPELSVWFCLCSFKLVVYPFKMCGKNPEGTSKLLIHHIIEGKEKLFSHMHFFQKSQMSLLPLPRKWSSVLAGICLITSKALNRFSWFFWSWHKKLLLRL